MEAIFDSLDGIFILIIFCSVLIVGIIWWLLGRVEQSYLAQFMIIHEGNDARTLALREIQDDLDKIKQKLEIYYPD